jgi:serine beta-lactamase-like protein LACTB, mitochondrial
MRRSIIIAFGLFLWSTILLPFSFGQIDNLSPEKRTQLDAATARFMAKNKLPGISIAVVENGEYEWSKGFGMADLENLVPATSQTLYRLASISKPITATAAMVLYERGKLDLDVPVQKYCPEFPEKDWPITTRQLLGHLGGIRHYRSRSIYDPEIVSTKHFDDPISAGLKFFEDDPLVARPGTKFSYSNYGYVLVGCVIEGASGQKYVDFVQKNVLQPAGMTHTRTDDRLAIVPNRTRFYSKDTSGNIVNSEPVDVSFKAPADGWLSSAEDMAKFEAALLNDRLVRRSTRNLMWNRQKTSDGKETDYGLGWLIDNDFEPTINDGGGEWGTSTFITIAPKPRAGVVVLINLNGDDLASDLAPELMKIVLGVR